MIVSFCCSSSSLLFPFFASEKQRWDVEVGWSQAVPSSPTYPKHNREVRSSLNDTLGRTARIVHRSGYPLKEFVPIKLSDEFKESFWETGGQLKATNSTSTQNEVLALDQLLNETTNINTLASLEAFEETGGQRKATNSTSTQNEVLSLDQLLNETTNINTLASLLKQCGRANALSEGRRVHAHITRFNCCHNTFLGNCLIEMYGTCGSMDEAQAVFDHLLKHNVYSWNILITAYAKNGFDKEALGVFHQMQLDGIKPNHVTYICVLDICASLTELEEGQGIHAALLCNGYEKEVVLGTALVNMYGKCGRLHDARSVFGDMTRLDVVSWSAIIAACACNGNANEALEFYNEMQLHGFKPNHVTFVSALDACACLGLLKEGREVHSLVVNSEDEGSVFVGTTLINMYGTCGSLYDARRVFDRMPHRNLVSWNAMLGACARNEGGKETLDLFHQMKLCGLKPNHVTFVCMLDACTSLSALVEGMEIHAAAIEGGYEGEVVVGTALVSMYGKCGSMTDVRRVFSQMHHPNAVSWNAMIAAYAQNGHGIEALHIFYQMQCLGIKLNGFSFACAVDACASLSAVEEGLHIHAAIVEGGFDGELIVGTALVDMYGNCGSMHNARSVFSQMPQQDVVSWSVMIAACAQNGYGEDALHFLYQMQLNGIQPNEISYICALDACASMGALGQGQKIHVAVVETGYEEDPIVGTALINMYGKCGILDDSRHVFGRLSKRNGVSWSTMIAVCAQNGYDKEALDFFHQMQLHDFKPDKISFISVLTACSHAGQIDRGRLYFISILKDHGITQTLGHYACMVDLLGRAGHLESAEALINSMPFESNVMIWSCLLGACKIHGDVERGLRAAGYIFELDPKNVATHVMLSNLYAAVGMWDD